MTKLIATMNKDTLTKGTNSAAKVFNAGTFTAVKVSYFAATSGVSVDLNDPTNNAGFAAGDSYIGINRIIGSVFDDTLLGNANVNMLNGGAGNDFLNGGAGNDILVGGTGNDTLVGGTSNDTFIGNDADGTDVIVGGAGIDTVNYTAVTEPLLIALGGQNFYPNDRISGVENAIGGSNNDTIFGNSAANSLSGGAGNDYFSAGLGNDIVSGGDGNDTIWAEEGNDFVSGGMGNDQITGGGGSDSLLGNKGDDRLFAEEGADTLIGGAGQDFYNLLESTAATDVVRVAAGESTPTAANPTFFDSIAAFDLGNGVSTTAVDQLDLDGSLIASNTLGIVQGFANPAYGTGAFAQFSITDGLISLYDAAGTALTVSLLNAGQALSFMALTNEYTGVLADGNTVALIVDDVNTSTGVATGFQSTIVFQDVAGNTADTVVQLQGWVGDVTYSSVIATGISNNGMMDGGIWLVA